MPRERNVKTIVHIGAGHIFPGESGPSVGPRETHIVFEIDPKWKLRHKAERRSSPENFSIPKSSKIHWRRGSGVDTRLKNNSVDAIHMHNVLSAPEGMQQANALLREANRVLKPGGACYVGNFYTAYFAPRDQLEEVAKRHGFEMEVLAENSEDSLREWTEKEKEVILKVTGSIGTALLALRNSYLAKLTKKKG